MNEKRILCTGKFSFLGQNLLNDLTEAENDVYYFIGREQYDLSKSYEVTRLFKEFQPTHIVHLAGMASARGNDNSFIDSNIKATYNLLELCPNEVDFIFSSSVLVYGSSDSCMGENDKLKPNSPYAISKVCCENLIDYYAKKGKIRSRILRLCGVVGPNLKHGRIFSILNGERNIKLFGKAPGNFCPFITITDCIKTIKAALEYNKPNLLCNVAPTDNTISIERTLEVVQEEMGIKLNIEWKPDNQPPEYICCHNDTLNYQLNIKINNNSEEALRKGLNLIKQYNESKTRKVVTV